ncbi:MAG: ATP-binding protein [Octadecabacter sp.]|nr:ATP-binding protein [Octadecabacter sp.]
MSDVVADHSIHAQAVAIELAWLNTPIAKRLARFFKAPNKKLALARETKHDTETAIGQLITQADLSPQARCILALALTSHVNSGILDPFFIKNASIDRPFAQFGNQLGNHEAFQPTTETAFFMISGTDTAKRIAAMALFGPDHPLGSQAGVSITKTQDSKISNRLDIALQRAEVLCDGISPHPNYSPNFPAKRLTTRLKWDDLVLPTSVKDQLEHILAWLTNRDTILNCWGLSRHFGLGYKALFSGPPGTSKALTATLLGQRTGLNVYRVDLSMIVSKCISETEKNLSVIFDMSTQRDWILFFDEAEALFSAHTSASSSNDRDANQEGSYLLQRIKECQSLVILATNLRNSIDSAFSLRFQSTVAFSRPNFDESLRLWRNILATMLMDHQLDLKPLARDHDLSSASITNIIRHAAITARQRNSPALNGADINAAISAELNKEGRKS